MNALLLAWHDWMARVDQIGKFLRTTRGKMTPEEKDRRKRVTRRIMAVATIFVPTLDLFFDFYQRYTSKEVFILLFFIKRRQPTIKEALLGTVDTATSLDFLPVWFAVVMGLLILSKPQTPYASLLLMVSSAYPLYLLLLNLFM